MTTQPHRLPTQSEIDWHQVSQIMLKHALPINPLTTHPDDVQAEWDNILLSVGAVKGFLQEKPVISDRYSQEEFFQKLLQSEKSQSPLMGLIGAPGTGKTTLLHRLAVWLLQSKRGFPVWISGSALGKLSLASYLQERWLPKAMKLQNYPIAEGAGTLAQLTATGKVWLLIDSVEMLDNTSAQSLDINLQRQLQDWGENVKVVITGHDYGWHNSNNFLLYSPLPFQYPEEVKFFISKWLSQTSLNSTGEQISSLIHAIEQFGVVRIKDLWETPQRVALLCRLWQQQYPHFPPNSYLLYDKLVGQFYQWQAEKIPTSIEQQQSLNQSLSQLALKSLLVQPDRACFNYDLIVQVIGENTPQWQLALRVGWLKVIDSHQKIYSFADDIFFEYFAARAINDVNYFLPQSPQSFCPIFHERWRRVMGFWFGRDDIDQTKKDALLLALSSFQDGCHPRNLYGRQALYLAAACLCEFPESQLGEKIIQQLLDWTFLAKEPNSVLAHSALEALQKSDRTLVLRALIELLPVRNDVFKAIEKIGKGHTATCSTLERVMNTATDPVVKRLCAECLGKIDPGNAGAIQTLIAILEKTGSNEQSHAALSSLSKIGHGNAKLISALMRRLQLGESPSVMRRLFECLEVVGQNNATAIAALVQLIRTTRDPFIHRQAAESLEKIDPGNPTAIAVLIQLLQSGQTEEIRQQAVYSLGEITPNNNEAISSLVGLLNAPSSVYTRWLALSSLGKIGAGNPNAIEAIIKVIQTSEEILLQKEAIESLVKIAPDHPIAIHSLVKVIEKTDDESTRREAAEILGKLDPGNPDAITVLVNLLHNNNDEFTRRQAAVSLGRIDPSNLEAIFTLVQLIKSSQDQDIRSLAAESIGEIGQQNPAAIATLIRLLNPQQDSNTLKVVAASLGNIAHGNREAISTLGKMLEFAPDESTRLEAAESLIRCLPKEQVGELLTYARQGENEAGLYLLWYCSEKLPYEKFLRLWREYRGGESPAPEVTDSNSITTPDSGEQFSLLLRSTIDLHPLLGEKVHPICIDSGELFDADNPLVDIYDQMLTQGCPDFDHGIPDTISKLRLYWNGIRRAQPQKIFCLVFYENNLCFSPDFLNSLSKFPGAICFVGNGASPSLPSFSGSKDEVIASIVSWLEKGLDSSS
ncbi:MAG: hypothetical protein N5P05_001394 [Chroococcopsis gigantea SAG 12.99]|jgi:HEAT repeat protein|nr:HEAT repeat domain-containing protein [Chlorogloea purpurea SAG 13.99]MDV2999788.1 hypothetical protein [Chroococcopsis gigantea SAG 12.99]